VSETTGTGRIGQSDARDAEREDPSTAGKPEVRAFGDEGAPPPDKEQSGRLEEREQRQHAVQQHGDTFAVDSDEPTDTSGFPQGAPNRVTALPGDESDGDTDD
jgi:hypothetical protein